MLSWPCWCLALVLWDQGHCPSTNRHPWWSSVSLSDTPVTTDCSSLFYCFSKTFQHPSLPVNITEYSHGLQNTAVSLESASSMYCCLCPLPGPAQVLSLVQTWLCSGNVLHKELTLPFWKTVTKTESLKEKNILRKFLLKVVNMHNLRCTLV